MGLLSALSPERMAKLCHNECDNPSDERKLITRIEVVRILHGRMDFNRHL